MILVACAQALVAILVGVVLVMRGKRTWGWLLIALGLGVVALAVFGLSHFSP